MSQKIREILEEYRVRCVHGRKIGIDQDTALTAIDLAYKKWFMEMVGENKKIGYVGSDGDGNPDFTNEQEKIRGYNSAKREIRERIK